MTTRVSPTSFFTKPTEYHSSGMEPFVYRAENPADLLGLHAEIMGSNLTPGENLRHLLYAPIWEGRHAPFGIRGQPASPAVATTNTRFLISCDRHIEGVALCLEIIPFDQVCNRNILPGGDLGGK